MTVFACYKKHSSKMSRYFSPDKQMMIESLACQILKYDEVRQSHIVLSFKLALSF